MRDYEKPYIGQGVLSMATANFDSWFRSPRTILMLLFVVAICFLQMCGYAMTLQETGYTMHLMETLFYEFNFGCNMPMTTVLFLITVSELPRRIPYQHYSLIRSSRTRWIAAQMLYCIMMVVMMITLLLICISVMSLPLISPGTGWSDAERIARGEIDPYDALVDELFLTTFSPFSATIIAIVPVFLFWLTMVFIILLFGIWGMPVFGVMTYAFLMVANVTILFEAFPFQLILPIHFATLQNIISGHNGNELVVFSNTVAVYSFILILLVFIMVTSIRHTELVFYSDNKL